MTDTLRERKKLATREALSAAALRLALEYGPDNVRVDEIAEAAGVSPRTYNNYFACREQAIVAAIAAERGLHIVAALHARPAGEPLAGAVTAAVLDQYTSGPEPDDRAFALLSETPRLREEFLRTIAAVEQPLAVAIAVRIGATDELTTQVLAAAVSAAVRVAVEQWLGVPGPSLADLLRAALERVAPALAAVDQSAGAGST